MNWDAYNSPISWLSSSVVVVTVTWSTVDTMTCSPIVRLLFRNPGRFAGWCRCSSDTRKGRRTTSWGAAGLHIPALWCLATGAEFNWDQRCLGLLLVPGSLFCRVIHGQGRDMVPGMKRGFGCQVDVKDELQFDWECWWYGEQIPGGTLFNSVFFKSNKTVDNEKKTITFDRFLKP